MQIHPPAPLIQPAAHLLYRALRNGVDWRVDDPHRSLALDGPRIFAARHGQLLPLLFAMEGRGLSIVVSRSVDGELLASVLRRRGFSLVRGSASRAGMAAARAALGVLRAGGALGLAIDGPRGPRGSVQPSLLRLARAARASVIPLRCEGAGLEVPHSWDGFVLPVPGRRALVQVGAAIDLGDPALGLDAAGAALARALGGSFEPSPAPAAGGLAGVASYGHP